MPDVVTQKFPAKQVYERLHFYDYAYRYINHGVITLHKWGRHVPMPGCRILEFGCGNGMLCRFLAESGYRVTGIDIAQGQYDRIGYSFYTSLDDVKESWDCAVSFDVLEHLTLPELHKILPVLCDTSVVILGISCAANRFHETALQPKVWVDLLKQLTHLQWDVLEIFQRHTERDSTYLLVKGIKDACEK